MNKFSRRERKLIKELTEEAKALGYAKGYIDGIHDGNPFTLIVESLKRFVDSLPAKEIEKLLEAVKDDDWRWKMSKESRNHNLGLRSRYSSLMFDSARCHDSPLISPQEYEAFGRAIMRLYREYVEQEM